MKHLFQVDGQDIEPGDALLVLDLGMNDCSWGVYDRSNQRFVQLGFEQFEQPEGVNELESLLSRFSNRFHSAFIAFSNPFSILYPQDLYRDDNSMIKSLYGIEPMEISHDMIREWRMVNQYGVPGRIYQLVGSSFKDARYIHGFTPVLRKPENHSEGNQIQVHFYSRHFRVLVRANGQILLVQMYEYNTPLDVVYYLLKICLEFGISQEECALVLSGLVDADSALYKQLKGYFRFPYFSEVSGSDIPQTELPLHYFAGMIKLAQCAS